MMDDQARKGEARHRSPQVSVSVVLAVCEGMRGLQ